MHSGGMKMRRRFKTEELALRREIFSDKHPDTVDSMHNLAIIWSSRERRSDDTVATIEVCLKL